MAFNDSFGLWGHYAFSSKPTHGRSIFESMSDGMGDSYNNDFNSLQSARLYADSICLASAQYQLDRAFNNRNTSKATELLGKLEEDFQVTPGPYDTLIQRRAFLSSLFMVSKGNSQSVMEAALQTLLGNDFVSYSNLSYTPFPIDPGTVGIFTRPDEPVKQFFITTGISEVGHPITVPYTISKGMTNPVAGEIYTIDPNPLSNIEQVTISSVSAGNIIATFFRAHEPGTIATRPYPFWISYNRYSTVVVKFAIANDNEKRRKINELMNRAVKGISQWCVVSDQGTFVLDSSTSGILGSTILA